MSGELLSANDSPIMAESLAVTAARMDGKLDRVLEKIAEHAPRIANLEHRMDTQEKTTLELTLNAQAEEAKKVALALALKEADEQRRTSSDQSWSVKSRFITTGGFIFGAITLYIYWGSVGH